MRLNWRLQIFEQKYQKKTADIDWLLYHTKLINDYLIAQNTSYLILLQ